MSITTGSTKLTLKDINDKFSRRQFRKLLQTVNLSEEETDNLTLPGFESRTVRHVRVCACACVVRVSCHVRVCVLSVIPLLALP